ncbi:hypothetical protein C7H19_22400 [Aphanothece hegewaldii CCALA 016]|uniref:Filamentous haemagglutinin FhaB/tRNA nuclease CdiA-like TPS domain-containing protein n=1 Tax=Aphanothece hegewaldii CCALA 016 TaxID=2107694 RepID=A0A2T1LRS0_9CHRO|nr:CHAT domain-containing protein [Aphanothece hegewaldii]PSF31692.1 hypothetical protein C7H19_22400 [Aphanothece hegewaldii CCALA 016]
MKKLSFILALLLTSYIPSVQAQQVIPANDGTATLVTPNGQRIIIDGGTLSKDGKNLFHSFQEFGLSASQIATFLSNPDIRNILSRVVGGNPSYINGLIEVMGGNSNLYLVNPAGIVFGAGARLNVPADFIATTAHQLGFANGFFNAFGTNDYLNLVGSPNTFHFGEGASGTIINAGVLQVSPDSNVSLVAGNVINTGTINAPGGKITIAAVPGTSKVKISQEGQILSLEIEPPKDTQGNSTALRAINLPTLLTGAANQGVETGLAVTPTETVQQISTGVTLPTEPSTTIISGTVNGKAADLGGEISILGTQVGLINATVDASGSNGGGTVLIGGDYQGKGTVPNARATYVSSDSVIKADALTQGNGGKVIVWADGNTYFKGTISAQGGVSGGNGGFVEVSGKENLFFDGQVNTTAINGNPGTLLLDPQNVIVINGDEGADDEQIADGQILADDEPSATFTISENALQNLAGTTNVNIEATDNITINDLTDNQLVFASNITTGNQAKTSVTFRADANNDEIGNFSMSTNDTITARGRNVSIVGANITVGSIDTSAFANNISGQNGNAGDITLSALNNIQVAGSFSLPSGDLVSLGAYVGVGNTGNAGNINLTSLFGNITFNVDNTSIVATTASGTAGSIQMNALFGTINLPASILVENFSNSADQGSVILSANTIQPFGSASTLTFTVDNNININAENINVNISQVSSSRPINIKGNNLNLNNNINSGGGNVNLTANETITVGNNVNITSSFGDVTLHADADNNNSGAIRLNSGSSITSGGGDITLGGGTNPLTQPAVGTTENVDGIYLENVTLSSGGGDISLRGTGNGTVDNATGIRLGNTNASTSGGDITLVGIGGGTESRSDGILLELDSIIQSTGNKTISLTGTGGTGVQENSGIDIRTTSQITSVDGNIILNGTGGSGSGIQNEGIILTGGSTIQSTGNGTIFLTGTGGTGTDNLYGIIIGVDPSESSTIGSNSGVTSASGAITLTGTGGGTGNNNYGIFLNDSGTVESTGNGNLTLIGTGGSGGSLANPTEGILIQGINSKVSSSNGNINLQGTLPANNTGNSIFSDTSITTTGTTTITGNNGNVALNGNNNFGTVVINSGNNVTLRDINDITLGTINITGALTVNSPNNTQFNGTVQAGSLTTDNSVPSTTTDRTTINTSSITTTSSQTYNDPVTLNTNTTLSGNNITFNNPLNIQTFTANFAVDNALIFPTSGVTGTGTIAIAPRTAERGINIGTGGTDVLVLTNLNNLGTEIGQLNIGDAKTGTITINTPLTFNYPFTFTTGSNFDATQPITTNGRNFIVSATTIETQGITTSSTTGGNIQLTSTTGGITTGALNASSVSASLPGGVAGEIGLTAKTDVLTGTITTSGTNNTGKVTLTGDKVTTGAITAGGAIAVNARNEAEIQGNVSGQSLTVEKSVTFSNTAGTVAVNTTGNQEYKNNVTFNQPATLSSTSGNVTASGNITGTSLTVNAPLTVGNSTGSLISTTNNQTYTSPVTLAGNTEFRAGSNTSGTLAFSSLDIKTHTATFTADNGVTFPTSGVTGTGTIAIVPRTAERGINIGTGGTDVLVLTNLNNLGSSIGQLNIGDAKTGTITINTPVTFNYPFTFTTGSNFKAEQPITTNGRNFIVSATTIETQGITTSSTTGGNIQLTSTTGGITTGALNASSVSASLPGGVAGEIGLTAKTDVLTGPITTSGTNNTGKVTLTGNQVTTNAITAGGAIAVNARNEAEIRGNVSGQSLTVEKPLTLSNTAGTVSVNTTSNQEYKDTVTLNNNTDFTGNTLTFNNTLNANGNNATLTANAAINFPTTETISTGGTLAIKPGTAANNILIGGTGTGLQVTNLNNLNGYQSIVIGSGTTANTITVGDALTFKDPLTLQAATINVNETITGEDNASLTINSGTQTNLNGGSIDTKGSQIYNGAVVLGASTTLTGNNITFNNTLNVGSNSVIFTANDVLTLPATDITTTGGTNTVTIQPNTTSNIFLGTNTGDGLQVTNLNSIKGFQSLMIGTQNTETITVSEPVTFYDPTTLQAANINVNETITGADNASITIIGAGTTTTLYADIITNGNPIRIQDNVLLGATEINLDTTNNDNLPTGADITITGTINSLSPDTDSDPYSLLVEAGTVGNVTFGGAIGNTQPLDTLTILSANETILNGGSVDTINDQAYTEGNIILGNNTTLTSSEGDISNSEGKTITGVGKNLTISANNIDIFNIDTGNGEGTINLTADLGITAYSLTGGEIQLKAPIIGILNSITGTTLTTNGLVSFFGGVPIDVDIPQSPSVTVTTTGSQTYNSLVAIASKETATFTSNDTVTVNQPINTLGTDLNISANTINTSNIVTSQVDLTNLNINSLNPDSDVTIPDFFPSPLSGSITLKSNNGLIQTGNLNTANTTGANINVNSASTLTTGAINTSGTQGNGGNVTLKATQDVVLSSIDARSLGSTGGTVNITTPNNVRITDTIPNTNASISTEGTQAGGNITIQYDGDENLPNNQRIPFIIGNSSLNGSAGAITSGGSNINSGNFVFTERQGNVAIISVEGQGRSNFTDVDDPGDFISTPVPSLQATVRPPVVPIATVDQAKSLLQNIERVTAEKPAIIYVSFKPRGITIKDDFARQEAALTQEYETGLNLDSNVSQPTITTPSQDTHELDLLMITSEGEPISIPIKGVIRQQVIDAAEKLYLTASDKDSPREQYEPSARQLYQWLISPLEKTLAERKINNILFVMPAGLRIIPIAALIDVEGKFLAEKYSSGFAPSLSLNDNTYRDIKEQQLLALGASQFADPNALGPLPAVQVELPSIENIWQGRPYLINEDFTINNLRESRQKTDFGIIHLSTHGEFKPGELNLSYIQFYDRRLNLDEVRTLGLNRPPVELLVLSACRTAFGDENIELGFAGLAVKAGVKSALASLWWVGDTGTLAFMTDFYGKLKSQDVPIKAEAVRKTQVDMIQGRISQQGGQIVNPQGQINLPPELAGAEPPDLTHPYYWAPFTLIGNPW